MNFTEGGIYWSTENLSPSEVYLDGQRPSLQAHRPCKADALSVEATSYALLVYIAREGALQENIVRWLNTMRMTDGGFISSQVGLMNIYNHYKKNEITLSVFCTADNRTL